MDMFNIDSIRPLSQFSYGFKRSNSSSGNGWEASLLQDKTAVGTFIEHEDTTLTGIMEIAEDWESLEAEFKEFREVRPEYIVGKHLPINEMSVEAAVNAYERLLLGVAFLRAEKRKVATEEGIIASAMKCINWLRSTDFYEAPASARYHEAEPAGLLYHTLKVVNAITDFWSSSPFSHIVNIEDAVLCALVHDWCKINMYEKYMRNVKNEETGRWEAQPAYRYKEETIPLGHGEKSAYLARQFFKLSLNEELAIVHHMQKWAAEDDYHQNALTQANKINPLNLMLAFADCVAITNYYN